MLCRKSIIASDIEEGLYVLSPTYQRGAYLEGTVRDASTNLPVNGVNVEILSANQSSVTSTSGEFAMGVVNASSYNVVFSRYFLEPYVLPVRTEVPRRILQPTPTRTTSFYLLKVLHVHIQRTNILLCRLRLPCQSY